MALTPKQEKFAQAVADGNTYADAYRIAFDVGEKTKAKTIQENGSRMMMNTGVAARVRELRDALVDAALWTREDSVKALRRVADLSPKGTEIVAAVAELNKMHGFNAPEKIQVSGLGVVILDATDGRL